jgi:aromatic-L-amino-acid decarboxylase
LSNRDSPLHIGPDRFRQIGHQLVDQIAALLESIPNRPVTRDESPSSIRDALGLKGRLPENGGDPGTLLATAARLVADHSLFNGHPRFFGYITSSPAPVGMLADFLASALNPNVGGWLLSPAATEIEAQTIRWIAELIGYPVGCGGLLVSGGNMANFVCFLAARAAGAGWDVRADGISDGSRPRLRCYASAETHTWIQKAADLAGIGTAGIRWIPTDRRQRMDVAQLAGRLAADKAAGDLPFIVVGTAGSVSTGAVDPLGEIGSLCREQGVWFHVDGAYGGFAAAVPDASADLRALADADSVAVDPHKWLYAPLEAGCALVRDPEALRRAFSYHPPYYHFEEQATNYVDFGPQNSRGFRALKVWLALQQAGASGYRRMIEDDIALSRHGGRRRRAPRARAGDPGSQHHDVPLRAGGPARERQRCPARVRRHPQPRPPGCASARRRGLRVQRGGVRPLRSPRLHRQFSYLAHRRAGGSGDRRAHRGNSRSRHAG